MAWSWMGLGFLPQLLQRPADLDRAVIAAGDEPFAIWMQSGAEDDAIVGGDAARVPCGA